MNLFARLFNRAAAPTASTSAGGISQQLLIANANRYRDQYNPLRSLTITQVVSLLEAGQRGEYADLQWTYRAIERRDEDLIALIERRTGALLQLDWNIKIIDKRRAAERGIAYDANLAEEQAATLRSAYERIENLYEAIECLSMAAFREFGIAQFADGDAVALPGVATKIIPIDPWNILRDGLYGDWYWNPEAKASTARSMPADNKLDPRYFLTRTWPRPLDEIGLIKYVRANLSQKDWDAFIEIYGIPGWIIIGPPNIPAGKEDEYKAAAEAAAQGMSGYLPNGADAKCADQPRGTSPFQVRLEYLTQKLVLAGTGGLLTMLTAPGSGTLAGSAHQEAFDLIARSEARKISEIFQRQFDKVVLSASHPGRPRLAYFDLASNEEQDVGEIIGHAVAIKQAGGQMDLAELSEKTGYTITAAPVPSPFPGGPGSVPTASLSNREQIDAKVHDTLLTASAELYAQAMQKGFLPLAERLQAILRMEDATAMEAALRTLQGELPQILTDLNAEPATASALADSLTAAFFNGLADKQVTP